MRSVTFTHTPVVARGRAVFVYSFIYLPSRWEITDET
jgi:hypothetical protein